MEEELKIPALPLINCVTLSKLIALCDIIKMVLMLIKH